MAQALRPFPWAALETLRGVDVEASRAVREGLKGALDPGRLAHVASSLLGSPVEITIRGAALAEGLSLPTGVRTLVAWDRHLAAIDVEDTLAARVVGALLGRPADLHDPSRRVGPELSGAVAAFLVTLARRAGGAPWRLATTQPSGPVLVISTVVLVGDDAFAVTCSVRREALYGAPRGFDAAALAGLDDLPIRATLVAAVSRASLADIDALVPGAAWAPGDWLLERREGHFGGSVGLGSPGGTRAIVATVRHPLGRPADLVLTPGTLDMAPFPLGDSPQIPSDDTAEALGDAEVVVRVEVGSITLPARAWAAMAVGDVVATGVRLGEAVTLRAGASAFARGELCELDGLLAVRILERKGDAR